MKEIHRNLLGKQSLIGLPVQVLVEGMQNSAQCLELEPKAQLNIALKPHGESALECRHETSSGNGSATSRRLEPTIS